jgi:enoyl-CoA hydratase
MTTAGCVEVERVGAEIAVLRLNRPEVLNAIDDAMLARVTGSLDELGADSAVRVVILTGAGRGFCAGLDIGAPERAQRRGDVAALIASQERFAGMTRSIRALRQPVIAAVNGAAAGAGMGLALAADIRVVSPSARFLVASIALGLSAGECGISYHLPRLVGAGRAAEIMLTGRAVGAEEAERIGLASRLVPADQLLDTAIELARAICANSPLGVEQTKRLIPRGIDASSYDEALDLENRTQLMLVSTRDFAEAGAAFLEKRPPVFTGR